jgi:hypothetical protein
MQTQATSRVVVSQHARKDGLTRDFAVEALITKGLLGANFVDDNP